MNWLDPGGWDVYKLPPHCFNHEQVPSLRSNGRILWNLHSYRGTSLRRNSSTSLNPSRNLKLRLLLIPPMVNLANLGVRCSGLKLAIHSDGLLEIFWRHFRKSLNLNCEKSPLHRPLSQRNCRLLHHRQTRRLPPLAPTQLPRSCILGG